MTLRSYSFTFGEIFYPWVNFFYPWLKYFAHGRNISPMVEIFRPWSKFFAMGEIFRHGQIVKSPVGLCLFQLVIANLILALCFEINQGFPFFSNFCFWFGSSPQHNFCLGTFFRNYFQRHSEHPLCLGTISAKHNFCFAQFPPRHNFRPSTICA